MSKSVEKRNQGGSHLTFSGTSPGVINEIAIALIVSTLETQSRYALNQEVVAEYAEAMAGGVAFPPVAVFEDGDQYWLGDGFHRLEAIKTLGKAGISAEVRQGDKKDALLYAIGANRNHGLRRNNDDKRRAVELALSLPELAALSSRDLGARCGVSHTFVAETRKALEGISVNGLQPGAAATPNVDSDEGEKPSKEIKAPFTMTAQIIDDGRRQIQQFLAAIVTLQKHDRDLTDKEIVRDIL